MAAVAETVAAGGAHATSTIVGPPLGPDFSEAAVPAISAACAPEDLAPADVALAPADEDEQADAEDLVHVL